MWFAAFLPFPYIWHFSPCSLFPTPHPRCPSPIHPNRPQCVVLPSLCPCVLIVQHSPMSENMWYFIFCSCVSLLRMMVCYWVVCAPFIFWILTTNHIYGCKYFLSSYRLSFHFVDCFLCCEEGFHLMQYYLLIFTFVTCVFCILLKIIAQTKIKIFFPLFSSTILYSFRYCI